MKNRRAHHYAALKQVFHEPSRMALMTLLCASDRRGVPFAELKEQSGLTDGNLNRHLKALADAGAVERVKDNDSARSRTLVYASHTGREQFVLYLGLLEKALRETAKQLTTQESFANSSVLWNIPLTKNG